MSTKARMQTLARRVLRGHTEYSDEAVMSFESRRNACSKSCPDCQGSLHRDDSSSTLADLPLDLYICGICGGSWILAARH